MAIAGLGPARHGPAARLRLLPHRREPPVEPVLLERVLGQPDVRRLRQLPHGVRRPDLLAGAAQQHGLRHRVAGLSGRVRAGPRSPARGVRAPAAAGHPADDLLHPGRHLDHGGRHPLLVHLQPRDRPGEQAARGRRPRQLATFVARRAGHRDGQHHRHEPVAVHRLRPSCSSSRSSGSPRSSTRPQRSTAPVRSDGSSS